MSTKVLEILAKYDLVNISDLSQRLERLRRSEWYMLVSELDSCYLSQPLPFQFLPFDPLEPNSGVFMAPSFGGFELTTSQYQPFLPDSNLSPLTFCFPCLPANALLNISTHLLVSDKVFLWDQLREIGTWFTGEHEDILPLARKTLLADVATVIAFYLRAKELIQEGKLILYAPSIPFSIGDKFSSITLKAMKHDRRFQKMFFGEIPGRIPLPWVKARPDFSQWARHSNMMRSIVALTICRGLQGLSTDFIYPDYAYFFRGILEVVNKLNLELPPEKRPLSPFGFSINGIQVPVLQDVPIERVLDAIAEEPTAFQAFRSSLNKRLLQISDPPGSAEREKQILAIRESIQSDVSAITLAYDAIKKAFSRKFALHVIWGSSSIIVAGLSTIGHNWDILATAGGSLIASVKEFAKVWLDYQQELLKLKPKENYFVWKILSSRTK